MTDSIANNSNATVPPVVTVDRWGKEHWSTFGYIETRIVDHEGVPSRGHMRCDRDLHPALDHGGGMAPTRLFDGSTIPLHDDWSCLDDAEAAGFLTNVGTGLHRVYRLTDLGREVANALRAHKAAGGTFSTFRWPIAPG